MTEERRMRPFGKAIIRMEEFGPTTKMQEILKSHTDIVQSPLIELCLFAIGRLCTVYVGPTASIVGIMPVASRYVIDRAASSSGMACLLTSRNASRPKIGCAAPSPTPPRPAEALSVPGSQ